METIKKKKKKIKKKINALKDEIERLQERETSGTRDFRNERLQERETSLLIPSSPMPSDNHSTGIASADG